MDLRYAVLLGVLVGFSVLILISVQLRLPCRLRWSACSSGGSPGILRLLVAYGIIQALDGNVLVPILFSEAVNLHPVAIIVAVLVFGGMWGFWGVFFAIPLATLVKAVWNALPATEPPIEEHLEE